MRQGEAPKIIDAKFEVVTGPRPPPPRWRGWAASVWAVYFYGYFVVLGCMALGWIPWP